MKIPGNPEIKKHGQGEIVGLENVYDIENENAAAAVMENFGTIYEVPIVFFRKIAEKHIELEFECKKETTFFRIKNIPLHYRSESHNKSKFLLQLRTIKSLVLHNILRNSKP